MLSVPNKKKTEEETVGMRRPLVNARYRYPRLPKKNNPIAPTGPTFPI